MNKQIIPILCPTCELEMFKSINPKREEIYKCFDWKHCGTTMTIEEAEAYKNDRLYAEYATMGQRTRK